MIDDPEVLAQLGLEYPEESLDRSVVIRLPATDIARIDKLESNIRGQGYRVTRSAILRSYILKGLTATEADLDLVLERAPGPRADRATP